jgi:DNA-binding beta-propeller fold protein YncE
MKRRAACLALLIAVVPGCHRLATRSNAPSPAASAAVASPFAPRPIGRPLEGSTVALARVVGKRIAFVADADTRAIRRFDLDDRVELAPIGFSSTPGALLVLDDGKLLALAKEEAKLIALSGFAGLEDAGTDRAWMDVGAEPVGIALSADRSATYVASGWGHTLTGFRTSDFERTFEVALAREPRSVTVAADGKRIFVTHSVGSILSIVDVGQPLHPRTVPLRTIEVSPQEDSELLQMRGRPKASQLARDKRRKEGFPTCQSFALAKSSAVPGRLFIPEVGVDPGEEEVKTSGYGSSTGEASETPIVAVIDTVDGSPIPASMKRDRDAAVRARDGLPHEGTRHTLPCILPRAAAVDDRSKTLLVACQGIDALVAYDALAPAPARAELHRWQVGTGPTGIAIDPEAREAVVWSQFDRTLAVIPLDVRPEAAPKDPASAAKAAAKRRADGGPTRVVRIAAAPSGQPSALALGRVLFHTSGDDRISGDGRACASCHPDGRDDGLVWSTPEGPRRSIMLAGRLEDTAPFSWQGNAPTVQKHLGSTLERLQGRGLPAPELEALVTYVRSLPTRNRGREEALERPEAKMGASIFLSKRAGCSSCHSGPTLTDGGMHNVGSGRAFNTPSLVGVGSGGPWFHDGRFSSLQDLLKKSDGKMGHTKHLKPEELAALETFLRAL